MSGIKHHLKFIYLESRIEMVSANKQVCTHSFLGNVNELIENYKAP